MSKSANRISRVRTVCSDLSSSWLLPVVAILFGSCVTQMLAQETFDADAPATTKLSPGKPYQTKMDLNEDPMRTFVVSIPANARSMSVEVTDTPLLFDIFGQHEDSPEDFDHQSNDSNENQLWVTRDDEVPLTDGPYYITLDYSGYALPVLRNRTVAEVSFTINVRFFKPRVDGQLKPGAALSSKVEADNGWIRTYTIDVPKQAKVLRLDLDKSRSDLDMHVRHKKSMLSFEDSDHVATSALGRETLIIDRSSDPPLREGRYFIDVVEPWYMDMSEFTIYTSFDDKPPKALLDIPRLTVSQEKNLRAVYSSVEIFTSTTSASGTIVSPKGLILTNEHVVSEILALRKTNPPDSAESKLDEVVISVTLDPRDPPIEMFRGRIVDAVKEDDIGIVQITSGYYGQPLPEGYRFPFVEFGDAQKLQFGDSLRIVGYPGIGGLRNRPTVTMTQGNVSGFGRSDTGFLRVKTDAGITAGNSGGAALNDKWQLVGVPSMTVGDVELGLSEMGIVFSIDAIPRSWREIIAKQISED